MKKKLTLISATLLGLVSGSFGQGLLSIGQFGGTDDFESKLPFTTTIGVDVGYDTNPNNAPDGALKDSSATIRGGINTQYGNGSRTTNVSLNAGISSIYYFDKPIGQDDNTFYTARAGLNISHRVNRQFTVGDNFYLSYEIESDNAIGATSVTRMEQYLYGYNSLWASYAWTRRFSTVGRYSVTGIVYEDSEREDRWTQTFSAEMRYVMSRLTTLVAEYRYAITSYEIGASDYNSNFILVGADHALSSDLRATWRVGAEYRDYDRGDSGWKPHLETSLRYALADRTSLVWFNRFGYEDSEVNLSGYGTRLTFRSSLSAQHQLTKRFRTHGGITYSHDEFEGGIRSDSTDDAIALSLGVAYRMWTNWDLNAGYHFTFQNSDNEFREYDRHRISAGMSVTF